MKNSDEEHGGQTIKAPGTIENEVLIGLDGHLFLAGGAHKLFEFAKGQSKIPAASFKAFEDCVRYRIDRSAERSIKYLHVIVPEKQSVLTELLPFPAIFRLGEAYINECRSVSEAIFYPLALLEENKNTCFLRTDTHLADYGSVILTAHIASLLTGIDFSDEARRMISNTNLERKHEGDLGSKLKPTMSSKERYLVPYWNARSFSNKISGNNGIVDIWLSSEALTVKRLLIFGDSAGRAFARIASRFFRDTIFLRTPFFHDDIVDQIKPDFIITESVERYLSFVRRDTERPSFHMYPYLAGGPAPTIDKDFAEAFSAQLSYPRRPYQDFFRRIMAP